MAKWCFNYESGEYEYIEKDGFSIDRGEYVYNWDDSEYRHDDEEEECRNSLFDDEDDAVNKPICPWDIYSRKFRPYRKVLHWRGFADCI